jgi:MFS family permease
MDESEENPPQGNTVSFRSFPRVYYELIFIGFVTIWGMGLSSSFLPLLAQELDPSGLLVGLVVSAFFLARIFIELPGGIISDRIGRRRLLLLGISLTVVGPALCSQASNIYVLILGRAIWGLGTSFYFMNNTALIIDLFPQSIRGRALGTFQGVEFIGSFIGAPVGAFLASYMRYTNVFYFSAALTSLSLLMALSSGSLKKTESRRMVRASVPISHVFSGLKEWGITALSICSFSRMLIMQGIFQTIFELYLKEGLLFSTLYIGFIISLRTAGHILAVVVGGTLSDKFGRKPILMAGFIIGAFALAAYALVKSFEMFLLVSFFAGFGEGFEFTTLVVLLTDITAPSIRGGAIGLFRMFMSVGGFVGPMLFMPIYTGFSAGYAFYTAVAINIFNIILLATVKATRPEGESSSSPST